MRIELGAQRLEPRLRQTGAKLGRLKFPVTNLALIFKRVIGHRDRPIDHDVDPDEVHREPAKRLDERRSLRVQVAENAKLASRWSGIRTPRRRRSSGNRAASHPTSGARHAYGSHRHNAPSSEPRQVVDWPRNEYCT